MHTFVQLIPFLLGWPCFPSPHPCPHHLDPGCYFDMLCECVKSICWWKGMLGLDFDRQLCVLYLPSILDNLIPVWQRYNREYIHLYSWCIKDNLKYLKGTFQLYEPFLLAWPCSPPPPWPRMLLDMLCECVKSICWWKGLLGHGATIIYLSL